LFGGLLACLGHLFSITERANYAKRDATIKGMQRESEAAHKQPFQVHLLRLDTGMGNHFAGAEPGDRERKLLNHAKHHFAQCGHGQPSRGFRQKSKAGGLQGSGKPTKQFHQIAGSVSPKKPIGPITDLVPISCPLRNHNPTSRDDNVFMFTCQHNHADNRPL
jgi:hypothetical protein